jgi:hypothetical protein
MKKISELTAELTPAEMIQWREDTGVTGGPRRSAGVNSRHRTPHRLSGRPVPHGRAGRRCRSSSHPRPQPKLTPSRRRPKPRSGQEPRQSAP